MRQRPHSGERACGWNRNINHELYMQSVLRATHRSVLTSKSVKKPKLNGPLHTSSESSSCISHPDCRKLLRGFKHCLDRNVNLVDVESLHDSTPGDSSSKHGRYWERSFQDEKTNPSTFQKSSTVVVFWISGRLWVGITPLTSYISFE